MECTHDYGLMMFTWWEFPDYPLSVGWTIRAGGRGWHGVNMSAVLAVVCSHQLLFQIHCKYTARSVLVNEWVYQLYCGGTASCANANANATDNDKPCACVVFHRHKAGVWLVPLRSATPVQRHRYRFFYSKHILLMSTHPAPLSTHTCTGNEQI